MAFRKFTRRKTTRKQRFRRKRRFNRRRQVRSRAMVPVGLGFPKKMIMTHKYSQTVSLTSTGGIYNNLAFNCNSLFDPDAAVGGHQPLYFDQMAAIYDHYTVIGSKITIKLVSGTSTTDGYATGIFINDDSTPTITSLAHLEEQSTGKYRVVPPAYRGTTFLTSKWSAKKTFGGSVLGNDNLQGSSTSNPSELSVWVWGLEGLGGATVTVYAQILIEYIAVWDELRDIAQS